MIVKNLQMLKINQMTQEQYEREYNAGNIDENAIYLTPDQNEYVKKTDILEDLLTEEGADKIPTVLGVKEYVTFRLNEAIGAALEGEY